MALVLREVLSRNGAVKRFDVVRAEEGTPSQVLDGITAGQYKILDGSKVETYETSYRTVQDVNKV